MINQVVVKCKFYIGQSKTVLKNQQFEKFKIIVKTWTYFRIIIKQTD